MNFNNLKQVDNYEVQKYFLYNIPELTKYQKECIRYYEIIRFAPFSFVEERKSKGTFLTRLTLIPFLFVWAMLVIGLPFNFLFTGKWGYGKINWYSKWVSYIGL